MVVRKKPAKRVSTARTKRHWNAAIQEAMTPTVREEVDVPTKKVRRKKPKDDIAKLGPLSDAIKEFGRKRRMSVDEVKDDDDYTGEQVFSPDSDKPLEISGVFLVFDNQDTIEVYDIPASEFDGKQGHERMGILERAHGTYINTDNELPSSMLLYNMLQPDANRYDSKGKKLPAGDGRFFKYKMDQKKFMLIMGNHRYIFAGFAQ